MEELWFVSQCVHCTLSAEIVSRLSGSQSDRHDLNKCDGLICPPTPPPLGGRYGVICRVNCTPLLRGGGGTEQGLVIMKAGGGEGAQCGVFIE